ncbi:MAG: SnoaL-like domain-containing protein [Bacteroidetes bacterium]|mgnify:FL=1|jgi:hypothetical protein|nr:SnoaL-like domain-containing protein [Bacteroidota bacterium]MBT3747949.1 SnoaL-like domain-containing protein [Bacteroidota bacterium]MBT4399592.1 SnoaL-like domain-containing protein [Bacteroidota bacterium]MBT7093678.1 SnoaL-like domain-containing protein [Bacteroidota bacterium]MBT7462782.1 SnoaL-like domain-containing protein [Bacteroidota bacterium]
MKKLTVILGVIILFCACQQTESEMTDEQRQEIASTITQHFKDLMDQPSTDNWVDEFLSSWVENDDKAWLGKPALWLNLMTLYPDQDKIYEVWKPIGEVRSSTDFTVDEDYVAVLSAESAVYVFKGSFTITYKEGTTTDPTPMSGSYVYVLRDGKWKTLHQHLSWKTN